MANLIQQQKQRLIDAVNFGLTHNLSHQSVGVGDLNTLLLDHDRLLEVEKRRNEEHRDDRYDPMS